jgi:ribosomal protein L40E
MGTLLRNTLQVLAFAIAGVVFGPFVGAVLYPVFGWMFDPGGGIGAALGILFRFAVFGGLAGVIVGLYSLGLFQRPKRSTTRDTPVACLRCGFTIPQTESRCRKCGWTWGDEHESEEMSASPR